MWRFPAIDTVLQDVRYGLRGMRRSPGFTLTAVLSLGIAVGASSAVFGLADVLLFQRLPVKAPEELVLFRWFSGPAMVFESLNGNTNQVGQDRSSTSFSRQTFEALRAELAPRADVFGFADIYRVSLSIDGRSEAGAGHVVSGNYFRTLGIAPAAGRLIEDGDDRPGAPPVAVIGYDFWQRRFDGGDAIGRTVTINGNAVTIVGVTPKGFRGTLQVGQRHDVMVPMSMYDALDHRSLSSSPTYWWVLMMARLKPDTEPAALQAAADTIVKRTTMASRPQLGVQDLPRMAIEPGARGQAETRDGVRDPLAAMAMVVGTVLLIACANVANLLLARGRARARELTIRVAIGASRGRLVRQLVTEALLLAILGGVLGLALAKAVAAALLPALTGSPDLLDDASVYWRVLGFTTALAGVCTLAFGVLPARRTTDVNPAAGLQDASRGAVGSRRTRAITSALVVVQVALSMVLVSSAALLLYSVRNLGRIDTGFDPDRVLIFRIVPSQNGYPEDRVRALLEEVVAALRSLPGVQSASFSSHVLISGGADVTAARPAGVPVPPQGSAEAQRFVAEHRAWRLVTDERFFATMGIRLGSGRLYGPADTAQSQPVAVVNEALARQLFGSLDAIGRRMALGLTPGDPGMEIIGVVPDVKYTSLRREAPPTVYVSYRQRRLAAAAFAVRTAGDPAAIAEQARQAVARIDPTLPLSDLRTQSDQILLSIRRERLFARLASLLGGVALLLAAIGLYGLLAYSVARRTAEIGIRIAVGAERGAVRWLILRQSLVLVAIGLAAGGTAALLSGRVVESLLFGLAPASPLALATAAVAMVLIALAASFVPAHRAASIDPVAALRAE